MKLSGTHKFKSSSSQVFKGILNPSILQASIPGCQSIEFLDANRIKAFVTTPIPGLKGPYAVVINITRVQEPNFIELQIQRQGTGGSVNGVCQINISDEPGGAVLAYEANAELEGAVAMANNPIGKGVVNSTLNTIFKNLDNNIA
ncbi:hypothetical protein KSD_52500 [Ktedonobacter sp. SOSP1-85]|jgi:carbon monoxide dehydrogenase subunit G|uniref:Carbon monoxide dehydrogenase n=1 Tax=Ktedonobacter robiniae TaxID=2778365 RepID=A0ABQ3V525_9CHLR|nr:MULTISPECIES: SRPBCC domain-containing protein [Ktedonobacter]GHO60281.1 hypothetical protein KSB_87560 [Ktedonobacter robiniae]GHO64778.1 hypothetical protein KSC_036700 [Ktedonobacter sp. SOSP1-52]GHO77479.1 hypothetical protein KSD_52500 [Ktedonobacter sp. SOSP1-85]